MHFDTAIYEHHASSAAYNNVCELANITDSQCICITAVTMDTVSVHTIMYTKFSLCVEKDCSTEKLCH